MFPCFCQQICYFQKDPSDFSRVARQISSSDQIHHRRGGGGGHGGGGEKNNGGRIPRNGRKVGGMTAALAFTSAAAAIFYRQEGHQSEKLGEEDSGMLTGTKYLPF